MKTSTQPGACDLCRDIQRDAFGELAEQHDTRNHTHCSPCDPGLLAAEIAGTASCSFTDDAWRWELAGELSDVRNPDGLVAGDTGQLTKSRYIVDITRPGGWAYSIGRDGPRRHNAHNTEVVPAGPAQVISVDDGRVTVAPPSKRPPNGYWPGSPFPSLQVAE